MIIFAIMKTEVITQVSDIIGNDNRIYIEKKFLPPVPISLCDTFETANKLLKRLGFTKSETEFGTPYNDKFQRGFPNYLNNNEKIKCEAIGYIDEFVYGQSGYEDQGAREGWFGDHAEIVEIVVITENEVEHDFVS